MALLWMQGFEINKTMKFTVGQTVKKVKTSNIILGENNDRGKIYSFKSWKFLLTRQRGKVDYFFLLCMNELKQVIKAYLIPDSELSVNTIHLGFNRSKYDKYLVGKEMK